MSVFRLTTHNFRNLYSDSIEFHPQLNFIVGNNGSGKSSILEALFFLGHGKSFRTNKNDNIVCYDQDEFVVSIKDDLGNQLGFSRDKVTGLSSIKFNGVRQSRLSDFAKNTAVQIVTPESFKLFIGGPKERRRFIDLGMFHVKHSFIDQWSVFNKLLKQRNACIKSQIDDASFDYWTTEFCKQSIVVSNERHLYIEQLKVEFKQWLLLLLPDIAANTVIQYFRGWANNSDLSTLLRDNRQREKKYGYSLYGAQKFDVRFILNNKPIDTQLSRGQQKLFLLALTFAQAMLISRVKQVKPILLIDDIGAELDVSSRALLSDAIELLNCQVIITAIEKSVLHAMVNENSLDNYKVFHVKHGKTCTTKLYPDALDKI